MGNGSHGDFDSLSRQVQTARRRLDGLLANISDLSAREHLETSDADQDLVAGLQSRIDAIKSMLSRTGEPLPDSTASAELSELRARATEMAERLRRIRSGNVRRRRRKKWLFWRRRRYY